jgi:ribonuclease H2 subunit C
VLVGSQKILDEKKEREIDQNKNLGTEESMEIEEEEGKEDVKIMEEIGTFNEVLVWGHEAVADGEDIYIRSLEEWIGIAESVCATIYHMKRVNGGG